MGFECREAFRVKFCVLPTSEEHNPLQVCISEKSAEELGIGSQDITSVVSIQNSNNNEDSLFVSVRIRGRGSDKIPFLDDDNLDIVNDGSRRCLLWCDQLFLDNYKINKSDKYYVRNVEVFPVQKVILSVKNKMTHEWTTKVKFGAGLIVSICHGKVLVRENDAFLASFPKTFMDDCEIPSSSFYTDLSVLECVPVKQGILTVNTEMIIVLSPILEKSSNLKDVEYQLPQINQKGDTDRNKKISQPSLPWISDFAHPVNGFQKLENLNSIQTSEVLHGTPSSMNGDIPNAIKTSSSFVLCPTVLPKFTSFISILQNPDEIAHFDPLYLIGMPRSLMLKHGLFDGAVLRMSSLEYQPTKCDLELECANADNEQTDDIGSDVDDTPNILPFTHKNNSPIRLVQVKMLKIEYESRRDVFISPLLMFNIHPAPMKQFSQSCVLEKFSNEPLLDNLTSVSSSWDARLPFAKEVQISLVNSPSYDPLSLFTDALKSYFQLPRALSVGDVFAVNSQVDPKFYNSMTEDPESRYPLVYFKVIRIEPELSKHRTFIVDDKRTTLIQIGSVHSYIPSRLETYLSKGNNLSYWENPKLGGLEKYINTLESVILPHLSNRETSQTILPCILLTGQSGVGKTAIVKCITRKLGLQIFKVNCNTLSGDTPASTEARLRKTVESAAFFSPCVLLLQQIHVLGKDREGGVEDTRVSKTFQDLLELLYLAELPVVVIATTANPKLITADIQHKFLHQINMEVPSRSDRAVMLESLLTDSCYTSDVDVPHIAQRTAGFVLGDFLALLAQAKNMAISRICQQCHVWPTANQEADLKSAGVAIQQSDFIQALDILHSSHSQAIGAPKIPDVKWEDIGGLADVRREILDTIQLPLQHPELLAAGLRRSGVLLYGPPGSGKTLLAKAVATECSLNFLSVKGPELINKYVGQSEENVREVFSRARDASPCVIFFDELDSLAPNRGRTGDSGGVMDRVVSQILAELDGLHASLDVFVIGATNRPDLLDPALLRPGRFDKPLYLGVSPDKASQVNILTALTRKFVLDPDVDLQDVAEQCPMTLTGADFYALCSDAMLNALKRKIEKLEQGKAVDQTCITITQNDFLGALKKLTPSVSVEELGRYEELKKSLSAKT